MKKEKENKKRSALKSLVWRIVGIITLAIITFVFTQSLVQTGLVTIIHHTVFLVVFYFHERLWLVINVQRLWLRSLLKMFTYETLAGNIILGIIMWLVTSDFKTMTAVTLTYIGFKHIMYVGNEFIWKNIKWGRKITTHT